MPTQTLERTALHLADLLTRGWTVDLARLHGECHNHWYRLPHIEVAEASNAWQQDRAYERAGAKLAYTRGELLDRGWPAILISEYLGAPAATHDIASGHERAMFLWHGRDVARVEEDEDFQKRRALFWERSDARKENLAERAVLADEAAEAAASRLRISVPFDDIDAVEQAALEHRNAREEDPTEVIRDLSEVPQSTIDRWVTNYLRYACTGYDDALDDLRNEYPSVRTLPTIFDAYVRKYTESLVGDALAALR